MKKQREEASACLASTPKLAAAVEQIRQFQEEQAKDSAWQYPADYRALKQQCFELGISFRYLDNLIYKNCKLKAADFFEAVDLIRKPVK